MSSVTSKIKTSYGSEALQRYYNERVACRRLLLEKLKSRDGVVLELAVGYGGMTQVYKDCGFSSFIGVDILSECKPNFCKKAGDFIDQDFQFISPVNKIDVFDFDFFGSPAFEIQKLFSKDLKKHTPFGVAITDGLGLALKRSWKKLRLEERYFVSPFDVNYRYAWREHPKMVNIFLRALGEKFGFNTEVTSLLQGKAKNFTFASCIFS